LAVALIFIFFLQAVLQVLFNQIVIAVPLAYLGFYYTEKSGRLMPIEQMQILPSFYRVLLELPFHIFTQEVGFYYSHRSLYFHPPKN